MDGKTGNIFRRKTTDKRNNSKRAETTRQTASVNICFVLDQRAVGGRQISSSSEDVPLSSSSMSLKHLRQRFSVGLVKVFWYSADP